LALRLVERSLAAGHRPGRVAADEWAYLDLGDPGPPTIGQRCLLIRRNPRTGETALYRCWTLTSVGLNALIRTAGVRWKIEEAFQTGKGLAGPDERQGAAFSRIATSPVPCQT
jgi:hypothetical protein